MSGKDLWRYRGNVARDVSRGLVCRLAFEGTEIGAKNSFSHGDMLFVDGAVAHVDGNIHEVASAWSHDDVLHTSGMNSVSILPLGEMLGIASHSGNHGPEIGEGLIGLESIAVKAFAARSKRDE